MSRFLRISAFSLAFFASVAGLASAAEKSPFDGVRRVVFLGDSITYAGQYIEYLEAVLRLQDPKFACEFIDIGLPSETVSGLSEPGHAGGAFPRPTVHERLDRVLKQADPDLVVACYGMNDGIYYPYGPDRFKAYQDGIKLLREKAIASGAKVLHLTPPVFDPVPIKARTLPAGRPEYRQPFEGYDGVLNLYAAWLLAEGGAQSWDVIDIHGPMARALADGRARDPKFRFAGDGVHADAAGHWLIARQILSRLGVAADEPTGEKQVEKYPNGAEVLKLVRRKHKLLKDAWLTGTGHVRPGMAKGLPLADAEKQVAAIEAEIKAALAKK